MTDLETISIFLYVAGLLMAIVSFTGDYIFLPIMVAFLFICGTTALLAKETSTKNIQTSTPTTPVELLEAEHQRVVDSIEREYTIALKELELKQLKQLK